MSLITRTAKGSKLTIAEMDGNLTYLESIGRPYKVYTAFLSQTGTNAPIAEVAENLLDGEIVWSYDGIGNYTGTLNGAFISDNKVFFILSPNYSNVSALSNSVIEYAVGRNDVDSIYLQTANVDATGARDSSNNLLYNFIEIRVYN
jgi:hypothetical protein